MQAYSNMGRTKLLKRKRLISCEHLLRLRRRKPSAEFTLLTTVLVCSLQLSLLSIMTPKYFALVLVLMEYYLYGNEY